MDASSATIEVMDVQGKLIQATQIKSGDQVDLSAYERGVYTLRIKTESGTSIERIVKN
jgi:trimeric autotransporter adhesin